MSHPKTRAERRALARRKPKRHRIYPGLQTLDLRWAMLYQRNVKHRRAHRLGKLWPHEKRQWEVLMRDLVPLRILFVCSRNQWRSPTAEAVVGRMPGVETRSAGTSHKAKRCVTLADLRWADLVLVMEDKHASRLKATFRQDMVHIDMHVLDIPDEYRFMDPDLVEEVETQVVPLIEARR